MESLQIDVYITGIYIYIYIYICVCVCVCVSIYIYIYIYKLDNFSAQPFKKLKFSLIF